MYSGPATRIRNVRAGSFFEQPECCGELPPADHLIQKRFLSILARTRIPGAIHVGAVAKRNFTALRGILLPHCVCKSRVGIRSTFEQELQYFCLSRPDREIRDIELMVPTLTYRIGIRTVVQQ